MMPGPKIAPLKTPILLRFFALFKHAFTSEPSIATAIWKSPLLTRTLILSLALLLMGGPLNPEEAYAAPCSTTQTYSTAVDTSCEVPSGYDTVTIKIWGPGGGPMVDGSEFNQPWQSREWTVPEA